MPPLGDAVRLVYGKQSQLHCCQPLQEFGLHQPFRRHVKQVQFIVRHLPRNRPCLIRRQGRIEAGRTHSVGKQCIDLILHQCDQR